MKKNDISDSLVAGLVASQFPQWADLPIKKVDFDGHDNSTYLHAAVDPSPKGEALDVEHSAGETHQNRSKMLSKASEVDNFNVSHASYGKSRIQQ